ncbi:major facilitator superfamily domain-containing protein 12-like isoform X1 [Scylla paramamosain]|uniref:major facilitator superfamily domain-containing protein 12-like isoform X1 n=1 Tax=Scylla paramamosain TaxID=85552 RepID=UPI003082D1E1
MSIISLRTKLGYGFGHVLNDLCSAMWFTYLLVYFHHVLLFDNGLAGVVLLIGQVADALSTPFVGREADRTDDLPFCVRYGRRKTWHLFGSAMVLCAFPFIFMGCLGCANAHDWAQVVYYAPFVVVFQFGWAATQISHLSLIPSITQDPNDRTELNAIRYGFTVMSNVTVYVVTWLVLGLDTSSKGQEAGIGPEDAAKFRYIVAIVLVIGMVFVGLFHGLVKEKGNDYNTLATPQVESNGSVSGSDSANSTPPPPSPVPCNHFRMTATDWLKNTQFYQIAVLYMATRLFCNLSQAYVPIYLQDSLHLQEESVAYIPLVMYVSGFLTTTGMRALNKYIGRKASYMLGTVVGASAAVGLRFGEGPLYVSYLLYVVAALLGAGGSVMLVTSLSITADLIGPNVESGAFVYGSMSFTDKLSNGIAVVLIQNLNPCINCCPECSNYYRDILFYCCGGAAVLGLLAAISLLPAKIGDRRKGQVSETTSNPTPIPPGSCARDGCPPACPSNPPTDAILALGGSCSGGCGGSDNGGDGDSGDGGGGGVTATAATTASTKETDQQGTEEYLAIPQGVRVRVTSASSESDGDIV